MTSNEKWLLILQQSKGIKVKSVVLPRHSRDINKWFNTFRPLDPTEYIA